MASEFQALIVGGRIKLTCKRCAKHVGHGTFQFSPMALLMNDDVMSILRFFTQHEHGDAKLSPLENLHKLIEEVSRHSKDVATTVWNEHLQQLMLRSAGVKP